MGRELGLCESVDLSKRYWRCSSCWTMVENNPAENAIKMGMNRVAW